MEEDAAKASGQEACATVAKNRMIRMLADLYAGKGINMEEVMGEYNVSKRSIQRDFKDIRDFLQEDDISGERTLVYDPVHMVYKAEPPLATFLSEKEVYIIIKMLMESRGLNDEELDTIINKLVASCLGREDEQIHFKNILNRERLAYVAPRHGKQLIDIVWELQEHIEKHSTLKIDYVRGGGDRVTRTVVPVGLVFSEFYFYMIAYLVESKEERLAKGHEAFWPIVYRVDRIERKEVIKSTGFHIPYEKLFSEGEFRKRVQFMYNGELRKLKFYCKNFSLEAVLDRLPTAKVLKQEKDRALLEAEVFGGKGIEMWLKSQGSNVELVSHVNN